MVENNLEEVKKFLIAITKTKSWISFKNLSYILPKEQYEEFANVKRETLKNYYLTINNSEAVRNKIDELVEENVDKGIYGIFSNEEGEFFVDEISSSNEKRLIGKIDFESVDIEKLLDAIKEAMQSHLETNSFSDNEFYKAEELQKVLKESVEQIENLQVEIEKQKEKLKEETKEMIEVKGLKGFWQKFINKFKRKK